MSKLTIPQQVERIAKIASDNATSELERADDWLLSRRLTELLKEYNGPIGLICHNESEQSAYDFMVKNAS